MLHILLPVFSGLVCLTCFTVFLLIVWAQLPIRKPGSYRIIESTTYTGKKSYTIEKYDYFITRYRWNYETSGIETLEEARAKVEQLKQEDRESKITTRIVK